MSEPNANEQRVALISGANRGIGAAVARHLSESGWRLSLGMRAPARPDWAPADDRIDVMPYDALEPEGEESWVAAALARFGRIDAVVANAGVMVPKTVIEADDADLDTMLAVNVKAPRRLAKAAWQALSDCGRGRVVIISSLSGKRVKSAGSGLYSVSKFAALALAHALRQTGFEAGIRATAICPGLVATDMARALTDRADSDMTQPEDVARLVALALDLPNQASVAEIAVNCQAEESF